VSAKLAETEEGSDEVLRDEDVNRGRLSEVTETLVAVMIAEVRRGHGRLDGRGVDETQRNERGVSRGSRNLRRRPVVLVHRALIAAVVLMSRRRLTRLRAAVVVLHG